MNENAFLPARCENGEAKYQLPLQKKKMSAGNCSKCLLALARFCSEAFKDETPIVKPEHVYCVNWWTSGSYLWTIPLSQSSKLEKTDNSQNIDLKL